MDEGVFLHIIKKKNVFIHAEALYNLGECFLVIFLFFISTMGNHFFKFLEFQLFRVPS